MVEVATYYPPLDLELRAHLETVRLHLIEDNGYLDRELCPYPQEMRVFLRELFSSGGRAPRAETPENEEDLDLEAETTATLREITDFGQLIKDSTDASDKAAYFRVKTSLLEKLLSIKERAADVKEFHRLIQFLMRFAEDHLSPDQRTTLMDALKTFGEP